MMNKPICIILCAGKGSRMSSEQTHKVCFKIAGIPAIQRLMLNLQDAGIERFVVVVGTMADKVIDCVSERFDDVLFAFQKKPLGTGHATMTALKAIKNAGIAGPVLVVMGDKIIDPEVIKNLMLTLQKSDADAVITTQKKALNQSGGRVVLGADQSVRGIIESLDIRKAMLSQQACQKVMADSLKDTEQIWHAIEDISLALDPNEKVRNKILSSLRAEAEHAAGGIQSVLSKYQSIIIGTKSYDPVAIEQTEWVNGATYLFKQELLAKALEQISAGNIQNEIYLTDAVNLLANSPRHNPDASNVLDVQASGPNQIMAFNTVEELLGIEQYFTSLSDSSYFHISPDLLKPIYEWIRLFEQMGPEMKSGFTGIYGDDESIIKEREPAYLEVLKLAEARFGSDRSVLISRAPGRVNLMGRHVEHRGGSVNVISINKELLVVASPRNDDQVNIINVNPDFPDRSFRISDYLANMDWHDWVSFIESDAIKSLVQETKGDWSNYVKAAVLKLQYTYKDVKIRGMDMAFYGDIPMAAGLSSSSAIIVATAEAAVAINNLDISVQRFVDMCGEGEWLVGSRGGAGDHAAMKFGNRGNIAHLGFFPFGFKKTIKFPEGYQLIIANSHVIAQKSANARDLFNQRIASYEFGLMLLKWHFPQHAEKMERLRDVNPEHLGIMPSRIYEMLLQLPAEVTPAELFDELPELYHERIRQIMNTHSAPKVYFIRSVVLYGIAECLRSKVCADVLDKGDFMAFGKMMENSHNGDRVAMLVQGEQQAYNWHASDKYILELIDDLKSEDPIRVSQAQLEHQPGGYACSTPEIDYLIDLTKTVPGVIGAQLSGAGLGGCIMVLVANSAVSNLVQTLNEKYYQPRCLDSGILVVVPVQGSMVWGMPTGEAAL